MTGIYFSWFRTLDLQYQGTGLLVSLRPFVLGLQVTVVSLIRSSLLYDTVPMSFSPKDKLLYWIKVHSYDLISSYLLLCRDLDSSYCLDTIFAS